MVTTNIASKLTNLVQITVQKVLKYLA